MWAIDHPTSPLAQVLLDSDNDPHMWRSEFFARILSEVAYGFCAIAFLFFFYSGNTFCGPPQSGDLTQHLFKLALGVVVLDSVASLFGWVSDRAFGSSPIAFGYAPAFATLTVGVCLAYFPFWLYQGYGHFRLEYTPWNVDCLFREGYGMMFPIIGAPLFAAITLARELVIVKMRRRRA